MPIAEENTKENTNPNVALNADKNVYVDTNTNVEVNAVINVSVIVYPDVGGDVSVSA